MKELILREERFARTRGIQSKGFLLHNNSIVREKERERRKARGFLSDAPSKGPLLRPSNRALFSPSFPQRSARFVWGSNEEILRQNHTKNTRKGCA